MFFDDTNITGGDDKDDDTVGKEESVAGPEAGIYTHEEGTVPGDDAIDNAAQ